jgi:hypothetical protein
MVSRSPADTGPLQFVALVGNSCAKTKRMAENVTNPKINRIQTHVQEASGVHHPSLVEIHRRCWCSITCGAAAKRAPVSMGFLVAPDTESNQILGRVIAQSAPPLNVMDLKTFHTPARLATPAISL